MLRSNRLLISLMMAFALMFSSIKSSNAQVLGNEWINYNQFYFKFKVGSPGIYRIPFSVLQSFGMGSIPGNQFAIYREGSQVPIYVSAQGTLSTNDYIEFYGSAASGKMDTELYIPSSRQGNDEMSILTDTAVYFLTYSSSGPHLRLTLQSNLLPSTPPVAEPYCITKVYPNANPRAAFSPGESYYTSTASSSVYQSGKFDKGEGFSYPQSSNVQLPFSISNAYNPSAPVLHTVTLFYSKNNANYFRHRINNQIVFDTTLTAYSLVVKNIPFNQSYLQATTTVAIQTNTGTANVLKAALQYNRNFNFGGVGSLAFKVNGNGQTQRLQLDNLDASKPNIVVDLTASNLYYLGANSHVMLAPLSSVRELFFAADVNTINNLHPVSFRDYTNLANQGSYIILADNQFINIPNGGVEQYAAYRRSAQGGNYDVVIISANDLYDQFGWGYEYHPLSIKRFLRYAVLNSSWVNKPEYMFIIGKGLTYNRIGAYYNNRSTYQYPVVPTFGNPGSDNLFAEIGETNVPFLAIGRLSAMSNNEILQYLEKVKAYEEAQRVPAVPSLENSLWKKTALHIAGYDVNNQAAFYNSLNICKSIIEDTFTGAIVHTTGNATTDITESASAQIDSLLNAGVQYITYYGHATSSRFTYNLNIPEKVNSKPRFPIFFAYGCDVAKIFETTNSKTISEKYLSVSDGGSIAMIACTNLGWIGFLEPYMQNLYRKIARDEYGNTIGKQFVKNIEYLSGLSTHYMNTIQMQNFLLQGDPGLRVYSPDMPDYNIESNLITTNPGIINTTLDSFEINGTIYNLGKGVRDEVWVRLKKNKVGSTEIIYQDSVRLSILNQKLVTFKVPIDKNNDVGLFNFTISVNEEQSPDELSFANNKASIQLYIAEDNLVPIYPQEFAIVYEQGIELKASTLNPFAPSTRYVIELDTTEFFNSPLKQSQVITSTGGLIKWRIPIQMTDSTVYYWRTAIDSLVNGTRYWMNSSFIYLKNGNDGWNQSHYFQYKRDDSTLLTITEGERIFNGQEYYRELSVQCRTFGYGSENDIYLDNTRYGFGTCMPASMRARQGIIFVVFNPITAEPMKNTGQFPGATFSTCISGDKANHFEFYVHDTTNRRYAMEFLNSVPDGYYVIFKGNVYDTATLLASALDWKEDEQYWGQGISLYHALQNIGFPNLDEIQGRVPFAGLAQKGNASFPAVLNVGALESDLVMLQANVSFNTPSGTLSSRVIGPASEWKQLLWKYNHKLDTLPQHDKTWVKVYGLSSENAQGDSLMLVTDTDVDLSGINAENYPYLKLQWYAEDSARLTFPQLEYWRVLYQPLPEAALNPLAGFEFKDSLMQGEELKLKFAIENLKALPMDSMLVRYRLVDAKNTSVVLADKRYGPLAAYDTIMASLSFNPQQYPGQNYLFIEANPDNDQPEEYHPNNLGYLPFYVKADAFAPVVDVTFDGVHILNNDIVSAKPFIQVMVRDENKFSFITDTANVALTLVHHNDGREEEVIFDGVRCRFIPAGLTNDRNEAKIEFRPELEDGTYTLKVKARDNIGNVLGNVPQPYQISFEVINKSTITNVLNYPNPFSTSTQFVFTLTGSEVPQQFKIQILSVTGKVVKEITKAELGNIHIGRNITEYRWDGRDQYGQLLGNGVYLYRVITTDSDGNAIEKRTNSSVDKFFKNDYGKLYIMR
ncbi:MAG TPA: C25 family cysteine peptidase [Edaphocola sp.]|nr:C25 family cysteine peptidase [Edaphocola sp.]